MQIVRPKGKNSPFWKGGRYRQAFGYVCVYAPNHPGGKKSGYALEHILIAEKVLGKLLPSKAMVHHVNENTSDNRNANLVICEDAAYHYFLHGRMRALKVCGNVHFRQCTFCKKWDSPENNMYTSPGNHRRAWHRACKNAYERNHRAAKKLGVDPETLEAQAQQEGF